MKVPFLDLKVINPNHKKSLIKNLKDILEHGRVIEGPELFKFEKKMANYLKIKNVVGLSSGSSALYLALKALNIKKGDEVITPVFTCTATNLPLLYIGAKLKFADIDTETMNISVKSIKKLITKKTKAIVCVHYGGNVCDMEEILKIAKKYKLKVIEDAAQALGAKYNNKYIGTIGDFTVFSFQAIKHITTGDGGLLAIKEQKLIQKAKRLRWFGIDRTKKQLGIWKNDIFEVGYKYQMTDLGAAVGLEALNDFSKIISHRRKIYDTYLKAFKDNPRIKCVHNYNKSNKTGAWIFTICSELKDKIQKILKQKNIESNQVHFRNDKYTVFKNYCKNKNFPNMDEIEEKYLVLPVHTKISIKDAKYISNIINSIK